MNGSNLTITSRNENFWEQRKLENLSEHKSGTSIEKYFSSDGLYKVISIGSYGLNNEYIDQGIRAVKNKTTESKLVRSGQLTMVLNDKTANGNLIGRCLLISTDNEFIVNQRTEIIIPGPDLNGNYAYYYLNGPFRSKVKRIAQGGTQIYVNYSSVKKQKINYPIKDEQIKISKLLKIIKKLITLYDRKLKLLSQVKKYFLDNLFAEKEYPNLRFKYFKKDKWEKTSLNSIVTYSNGKAHEKEINNKGNLDLVMMNSITTGGRLITKKKILSPQDTLNKNDIVIVLSDIAKGELIGKSSVIPCDNQYVLNQRIGCLHPTLNIDSFFVSKYINQKNRYFKSHAAGTSQINLSRSDVLNCTIYIPKVDEQHCVSNFIINVEKIINFYEYKKRHIIQIKNILLNTMFI
ncbi:restriction endonuclease subunit S [Ligilactobacillus aviarius]|uniref:restriction endonuclease subunit S n=1 Tax=Ligilactobacillus aviarius TaxID=1606 RepID=UPI0009BF631F|nr:restriction endonuclease subunit S [Ligilactobacillus aviarius]